MSTRSGRHVAALGASLRIPPSPSQDVHPPTYHRCHSALSVPRTNTSTRLLPHDTAAGSPTTPPPSVSQLDQRLSHHLCTRVPRGPVPKTSSRFGPHDATVGDDVRLPPRSSQSLHAPSQNRCRREPSGPVANRSIRFGPHDTAVGEPVSPPGGAPTFSQSVVHENPLPHLCTIPLPVRPNRSRRSGPHDDVAGAETSAAPSRYHGPHWRLVDIVEATLRPIAGSCGSMYTPGQSVNHVSWWPMIRGSEIAVPGANLSLPAVT